MTGALTQLCVFKYRWLCSKSMKERCNKWWLHVIYRPQSITTSTKPTSCEFVFFFLVYVENILEVTLTSNTHSHTYTTTSLSCPSAMKQIFPEQNNIRVGLEQVTSSSGHATTLPLPTRWMTSLIQVVNNCSWNTTLCHWPIKGAETCYEGISHDLVLHAVFV